MTRAIVFHERSAPVNASEPPPPHSWDSSGSVTRNAGKCFHTTYLHCWYLSLLVLSRYRARDSCGPPCTQGKKGLAVHCSPGCTVLKLLPAGRQQRKGSCQVCFTMLIMSLSKITCPRRNISEVACACSGSPVLAKDGPGDCSRLQTPSHQGHNEPLT